jgi:hypothetical protein
MGGDGAGDNHGELDVASGRGEGMYDNPGKVIVRVRRLTRAEQGAVAQATDKDGNCVLSFAPIKNGAPCPCVDDSPPPAPPPAPWPAVRL